MIVGVIEHVHSVNHESNYSDGTLYASVSVLKGLCLLHNDIKIMQLRPIRK